MSTYENEEPSTFVIGAMQGQTSLALSSDSYCAVASDAFIGGKPDPWRAK
jgi:hypothetical protein